jgi:adenosylcobinamide-GDP ribazoletransferase
VRKVSAAFKYLTFWGRFSNSRPLPATVGAAAIYFPAVGLFLGLFLGLSNYILATYLHPEILSTVLVATLIFLTGGTHLEETRHTFDDMPRKVSSTEPLRFETVGFIAITLVILFKVAAVDSMDEKLTLSLLLAPMLARWGLLVFAYGAQENCAENSRLIVEQMRFWHLAVATLGTLALIAYYLGRKGLWIALALSVLILLARTLLYRLNTKLSQDNFGAIIEIGETLSLVLLASL